MHTLKRFIATFMLITAPFAAHADVASDIAAGVPAEQLITNALEAGESLQEILVDIAAEVGGENLFLFQGAAVNAYAAYSGQDATASYLQSAVDQVLQNATMAGGNFVGTPAGQAYALNPSNFTNTGSIAGGGGGGGGNPPTGGTGGSGGGGGQVIEAALCEAVGSESGCLDS